MSDKEDDVFSQAFGTETKDAEPPKAQPAPQAEPAPKAPEPEPSPQNAAPEPQTTQPEIPPEKPKIDPDQFKGYLDERDKRQAAERELAELRRQLASQQQQARPQEPPPDIWENPEGRLSHLDQSVDQRLLASKVQQSRFFAEREFGEQLVTEAQAWADALSSAHRQTFLDHPSPFHAAIEAYRHHKAASTLQPYGYDIDKLVAERVQAELAKVQPAAAQPPQAQLPPKVAGAGGSLGKEPQQSEGDVFRAVFGR